MVDSNTEKDPSREDIENAVIDEIRAAFANVSRKGGVSLHEADVIDDYGTQKQRDAARLLDTDKTWSGVPDLDIEKYDWVIHFYDPIGFRYYIPAYMVWIIKNCRNPKKCGNMNFDAVIGSLCSAQNGDRFTLFTENQSRAVCLFLRYMLAHNENFVDVGGIRRALKYWCQFCPRNINALGVRK